MNSIALILPFFGRLPNYFEFFLQSVGNNPDVDLLLFTDDKTNFNYPVNVKRHYITFLEFKKEIQSSFEFDLKHLKSPYNLCDFKPAYGFALQKYLLGYDFWGHCDCDLIFGKLRAFLTDNILNQYDKVYAGGSLSLYRNTTKVNARFMEKCTGFLYYKDVYTASSRLILCYDEWGPGWGVNRLWNDRYPERCYWRYEHDDVNPMFGDFRPTQNKRGECICYHYRDDGSLVRVFINEQGRKEEEATCYVHLQKRPIKVLTQCTHEFLVIPPGSIVAVRDLQIQDLKKLGRRRYWYYQYFKIRWRNLKRKLGALKDWSCIGPLGGRNEA